MIRASVRLEGVIGISEEFLRETREDSFSPLAKAAEKLVERAQQKLAVRSSPGAPSVPGTPPGMIEGVLLDVIGRTGPHVKRGQPRVLWGVGVGNEAFGRLQEHAAEQGLEVGDIFAYANEHELGYVDYDLARSYPARPYIRPTEEELESELAADWAEALR